MYIEALCLLEIWKEKQFEKMLMRRQPGVNFLLNRSKKRKTLLNLLSMSTTGPLIFNYHLRVRLFSNSQWEVVLDDELASSRNLKIWLLGKEWALSCDLPLSFWRWSLIGTRSIIASMPKEREVQNMPKIYITALCCILLSSLIGYKSSILL